MNQVKVELQIDPLEPFKGDKLSRQPAATLLETLIRSTQSPIVIGINSKWGTGKTTFIKMLKAQIEKNGLPTLYFNAWESDFESEPFISFISCFKESIKDPVASKILVEKAKSIGSYFLKKSIPFVVKVATHGVVDLNHIEPESISGFAEKVAEDAINSFGETKNEIEDFKNELFNYVVKSTTSETNPDGPLVFFIDELDRCKPSYAVALLERLKHIFNVKGIVFVLGIDREQLKSSFKILYGPGLNGEAYLKRFIDIDYQLPSPSKDEFINFFSDSIGLRQSLINRKIHPEDQFLRMTFITDSLNVSLRDVEHFLVRFKLIFELAPPQASLFYPLLYFMIILKITDTTEYELFLERKDNISRYIDMFKRNGQNLPTKDLPTVMEAMLIYSNYTGTNYGTDVNEFIRGRQSDLRFTGDWLHRNLQLMNSIEESYNKTVKKYLDGIINLAKDFH